jgi:hypothetical protein
MNRLRSFTISLVGRLLALAIISSFAVTLLPLANTSAKHSLMSCCIGKAEGHCDSGLAAPRPALPPDEPMCGVKSQSLTAESLDAVTVVADPINPESYHPSLLSAETTSRNADAESNASRITAESIDQPCRMDCGACATATTRQQKRQKSIVQARTAYQPPPASTTLFENWILLFSSNETWTRISPRGPPPELL